MTRKKVKLAFITNDSARKATYKKRKKGLIKKVSELSTLCGIEVCAIIYSPYESQPEVWPNNTGVNRVIAQFKRMPEMEQSKKMVNQESYTRQRVAKAAELLKKQQRETREKEITEVMYQCLIGRGLQDFSMVDLNDLGWVIDQNVKEVNKRIESLKKVSLNKQFSPRAMMDATHETAFNKQFLPPPPPPPSPRVMAGGTHEITLNKLLSSPVTPSSRMMAGATHEMTLNKPFPLAPTPSPRSMAGPNHEMGIRGSPQGHMENLGLDLSMDISKQRPHWFSEWLKNPSEHMSFGNSGEMINDNHQTTWSSVFFS